MTSKAKDLYVPTLKTKKDINEEALKTIELERSGKQLGLRTRFGKLNTAIGKYFRFKQVVSINGLSGHGKSSFLNMLLEDFKNPKINGNFEEPLVIVHNTWEMIPSDEVIRGISSKVEKSHLYLLSSEINKETGKYNRVNDFEFQTIKDILTEDDKDDHYYFDEPTTLSGIIENIKVAIKFYQDKYALEIENGTKPLFPKVVVALDHTLLVVGKEGNSIIDTMFGLASLAIHLKKKGYLVLFIGQLNNEIEKLERIKNVQGHFPIKSDVYAQAQLYNACDIVTVIHQPELLGILEYGRKRFKTSKLVHLLLLKNRFSNVGSVWFENALERGKFFEIEPESNT
jgi:hypothetical protein